MAERAAEARSCYNLPAVCIWRLHLALAPGSRSPAISEDTVLTWRRPDRTTIAAFLITFVVGIAALAALGPMRSAEAATASKSCVLAGTNTYACAFTILPGVPTTGSWLVQMVPPVPGSFTSPPTVSSATGCTAAVSGGGTPISSIFGASDYDVAVSSCGAGASVTILETISVTSSGVICQRVWVNTSSPFAQAVAGGTAATM